MTADMRVLERLRVPTPRAASNQLEALTVALSDLGAAHSAGIGVAIAARVTWPEGRMASGGLLALSDLPLARRLNEQFGVPSYVGNDGNLAALAEARHGAARRDKSAVTVTVGSGLGGGFTLNGRLVRGRSFAGNVGHMRLFDDPTRRCGCGFTGCWELRASGTALSRALDGMALDEALDRAQSGDTRLIRVLRDWTGSLSHGLSTLIAVLDPDVVVLGGGLGAPALELLDHWQTERLCVDRMRTRIVAAHFGDDAGLTGAALLVRDAVGGRA